MLWILQVGGERSFDEWVGHQKSCTRARARRGIAAPESVNNAHVDLHGSNFRVTPRGIAAA